VEGGIATENVFSVAMSKLDVFGCNSASLRKENGCSVGIRCGDVSEDLKR
jgi:hypothetical protein